MYRRLLCLSLAAPAAALIQGCGGESHASVATVEPYLHRVETVEVRLQDRYEVTREYAGVVEAGQRSAVGFELGGRVVALEVDEGDPVRAGQVLARLDTSLLEAEQRSLEARRTELEAERGLARRNLERVERLVADRLASDRELDELDSRVRALDAAQDQVAAQLEANALRRQKSTLVAPFDARVAARHVDAGVVLDAGTPVLSLLEASDREVRAGIPRRVAAGLRAGDALSIRIAGETAEGRVISVGPVTDDATRTRSVRVRIERDWFPGEIAYVRIDQPVQRTGAWVPAAAVTEGVRGTWVVYAAVPDGDGRFRLEARSVEVQHAREDTLFVSGALNAGERVVAAGLQRVAPGQPVRLEAPALAHAP